MSLTLRGTSRARAAVFGWRTRPREWELFYTVSKSFGDKLFPTRFKFNGERANDRSCKLGWCLVAVLDLKHRDFSVNNQRCVVHERSNNQLLLNCRADIRKLYTLCM